MRTTGVPAVLALLIAGSTCPAAEDLSTAAGVRAWTESVVIPTYPVGPASIVPLFESTDGVVIYPYTKMDELSFERDDRQYEAYVLENEYLRIMVLPAVGGRVFSMYDRVNGREVLYRPVSVKPSLIGIRGAWICGGLEWNFVDVHNATTHQRVSCRLLRGDDGRASIVVGDTERIFGMSWTVELTLRPGRACLEVRIVIRNRRPVRQRASYWTIAGFEATDQTQIIFPVWKVTGHFGRQLLDWPVRGGCDLSWYRRHQKPDGIYRAGGREEFIAVYDHGRDVGLGQFADLESLPGRKFWVWGNGDLGRHFTKVLTDDDRPYLEVESGDHLVGIEGYYLWPHEQRQYVEYWVPISRIGPPARLNSEAVVRMTIDDGWVEVGVLATRQISDARIEVLSGRRVLKQWRQSISPTTVFKGRCKLGQVDPRQVWLRVFDHGGRQVIAHRYGRYEPGPVVLDVAHYAAGEWSEDDPPDRPELVVEWANRLELRRRWGESVEALEQGYRRFPDDAGIGLALGMTRIKQGLFDQAANLLEPVATRQAPGVEVSVARYYLALALAERGRRAEAMNQLQAVESSGPMAVAARLEYARLKLSAGHLREAIDGLDGIDGSLLAEVYRALAFRELGQRERAARHVERALAGDPLMLSAQVERAMLAGQGLSEISALGDEQKRLEAAVWYMKLGRYQMAERLLEPASGRQPSATGLYLRAYMAERGGDGELADRLRRRAARANVLGDMPSRLAELAAFEAALVRRPDDANAHYLGGLVLFSKHRSVEAVEHWRRSIELHDENPIAHRCLAAATKQDQPAGAARHLERAVELAPTVARLYLDLDDAYGRLGQVAKRVALLERAVAKLGRRLWLADRLAGAYFDAGRYDDAVRCYRAHRFHVAEAGGDLHDRYALVLLARALRRLAEGNSSEALADLDAALIYPDNMNIDKPTKDRAEAMIHYWRGVALSDLGLSEQAQRAWRLAADEELVDDSTSPFHGYRALNAVHAALACKRTGLADRSGQMLRAVQLWCSVAEKSSQQQDQAVAMLVRALAIAAEGRFRQSELLLDRLGRESKHLIGYLRFGRTWLSLVKCRAATQAAATTTR